MNKQLIQNILYAGHCIGICSDWSEQAVNNIIDKLKDDDFVYNKDEAVMDSYERGFMQGKTKGVEEIIDKACEWWRKQFDGFETQAFLNSIIEDFRKAMENNNN